MLNNDLLKKIEVSCYWLNWQFKNLQRKNNNKWTDKKKKRKRTTFELIWIIKQLNTDITEEKLEKRVKFQKTKEKIPT